MSEVQRFWSHEASNIRCVREADFDRVTAERDAALALIKTHEDCMAHVLEREKELQQRLTAADERAGMLISWLKDFGRTHSGLQRLKERTQAALKPAEGGGDES